MEVQLTATFELIKVDLTPGFELKTILSGLEKRTSCSGAAGTAQAPAWNFKK